MNYTRTALQILARVLYVVAIITWPVYGPALSFSLFAVAASVFLIYDGPHERVVIVTTVALVGVEAVYGIGIGTLSLAYACTAAAFSGLSRWLNLRTLSLEQSWSLMPLVQAIVVGSILAWVMTILSVFIGGWVYHSGALAIRLAQQWNMRLFSEILGAVTIGIILVRRIDLPFRRPIPFGQ